MLILAMGLCFSFLQPGVIYTDGGIFSAVAYKDLHGGTLYVDAWENKPPGIFYLLELFMLLIPDPVYAVYVPAVLSFIGLALLIYTYVFNRLNSLSVSLFLVAMGYSFIFYKFNWFDGLYTEIYGALSVVAALVCHQKSEVNKKAIYRNSSYILLGLAFWFKEPFILLSLSGLWYISVYSEDRIKWFKAVIYFSLPSIFFIGLMALQGALPAFFNMLIYNFIYTKAAQVVSPETKLSELYGNIFNYMTLINVFLIYWIFRATVQLHKARQVIASLLILISSLSFVFISPYNFGHYYIPFYIFLILFICDAYYWNLDLTSVYKIPFVVICIFSLSSLEDIYKPELRYGIAYYHPDRLVETLRQDKDKTLFVDLVERGDMYIKARKIPVTYVPVGLAVHFQEDSMGLINRKRIYGEIETHKPDYLITNHTASYFSWSMPDAPYYINHYNQVDSIRNEEGIIILWKRKPEKY